MTGPKLKIPVFCLTVLGSSRHKEMHDHLSEVTFGTGCHFEFVAGKSEEDNVPFQGTMDAAIAKSIFDRHGQPSRAGLSQLCRAMNVKAGMMCMMQRIIDLRCEWAIAMQDDVHLLHDWHDRCVQAINAVKDKADRITITCVPRDKVETTLALLTKSYCTETASLVTPSFCSRYIMANRVSKAESDVSLKETDGECVVAYGKPAAYLLCTKSTIAEM